MASGIGAAPEIIDDSCGMLVPPGDPATLASALGRLIEDRLYGVTPVDVVSLVVSVVVLTAVALVASWAPARRASRVDPVDVLRTE